MQCHFKYYQRFPALYQLTLVNNILLNKPAVSFIFVCLVDFKNKEYASRHLHTFDKTIGVNLFIALLSGNKDFFKDTNIK